MKLQIEHPQEEEQIDITPMIDCIFLLVPFFMVTSTFIEEPKVYRIVLPQADKPATISRDEADCITVTVAGEYFYRETTVEAKLDSLEALLQKLKAKKEQGQSRPVIIRCDARAEYEQFMEVKNVLKLAGVETIFEEVVVRHYGSKP